MLHRCLIAILFLLASMSAGAAPQQERQAVQQSPLCQYELHEVAYEDVLVAQPVVSLSAPVSGTRVAGRHHGHHLSPRSYHANDCHRAVMLHCCAKSCHARVWRRLPNRANDYYLFYLYRLRL